MTVCTLLSVNASAQRRKTQRSTRLFLLTVKAAFITMPAPNWVISPKTTLSKITRGRPYIPLTKLVPWLMPKVINWDLLKITEITLTMLAKPCSNSRTLMRKKCEILDPVGHSWGHLHKSYKLHACAAHCFFYNRQKIKLKGRKNKLSRAFYSIFQT